VVRWWLWGEGGKGRRGGGREGGRAEMGRGEGNRTCIADKGGSQAGTKE